MVGQAAAELPKLVRRPVLGKQALGITAEVCAVAKADGNPVPQAAQERLGVSVGELQHLGHEAPDLYPELEYRWDAANKQ